MSANDETWNELLDEIEKLAVSVGLGHPGGIGLGFDLSQMQILDNIIMLGMKARGFDEAKQQG